MPAKRERSDPERRLVLEHLSLERLKLDPANARLHKPAQIKQIAASITAFNFNVPVLIDQDDKVLAGHGRVLACRKLGWTEIPVIRLEHLTPEQARAFAIADNRLTETSVWDEKDRRNRCLSGRPSPHSATSGRWVTTGWSAATAFRPRPTRP